MFILLVSRRLPGIGQYALNLYKLLTNAFSMCTRLEAAGEAHRYWQRAAVGIPPCHLEAL